MSIVSIPCRAVKSLIVPLAGVGGVLAGALYVQVVRPHRPELVFRPVQTEPRRSEPDHSDPPARIQRAFKLIAQIESSGDPKARGPRGELGIVQLMPLNPDNPGMLDDYNRIMPHTPYTNYDRANPEKSYKVFRVICRYYYPFGTLEQWARLWHRGPNKARQYDEHGDRYWAKVQTML
tara:strand:+ start:2540 stop:3073 length:534 start_codon:yes stop_codon:yes gene_type:complete